MSFLPPLLAAGVMGALAVVHFTRGLPLRFYALFVAALALPVGFALCSLLIFFLYLLSASQAAFLTVASACGLSVFFLIKILQSGSRISKNPLAGIKQAWREMPLTHKILSFAATAALIFIALKIWNLFWNVSAANIFGGWDARFFWNVKAKFLVRDPSL